jgi:hypothetical protein
MYKINHYIDKDITLEKSDLDDPVSNYFWNLVDLEHRDRISRIVRNTLNTAGHRFFSLYSAVYHFRKHRNFGKLGILSL